MSTVVITGGSRGIGAAAVEAFADKGHKVYFLYEKNHEANGGLFLLFKLFFLSYELSKRRREGYQVRD